MRVFVYEVICVRVYVYEVICVRVFVYEVICVRVYVYEVICVLVYVVVFVSLVGAWLIWCPCKLMCACIFGRFSDYLIHISLRVHEPICCPFFCICFVKYSKDLGAGRGGGSERGSKKDGAWCALC